MDDSLIDEVARHCASLRRDGFTIIEGVIPPSRLAWMKDKVEQAQQAIQQANADLDPELKGATAAAAEPQQQAPQELVKSTLAAMDLLPDPVTGVGQPYPPERRAALLDAAAERLVQAGVDSVYPPGTPTGPLDRPGLNDIAYVPELAEYLAHDRVVGVAKAMLDVDVRIAQTEVPKSIGIAAPTTEGGGGPFFGESVRDRRHWHSDWPHDIGAGTHSGHVSQPFPDVCMALSTVWYLTDVGPYNGSTMIVPGSHKDLRNPRGADDEVDEHAPVPGEVQVVAKAGSVLVQDSRLWHTGGVNTSDAVRTSVVVRYAPWWLSVEFGRTQVGFAGANCAMVPADVFESLHPKAQPLYSHRVPGRPRGTSMQKVMESTRNSETWGSEHRRSNDHIREYEARGNEIAAQMLSKL